MCQDSIVLVVGGDWFPLRDCEVHLMFRDPDVFMSYCRLLSPCVLDRSLVFINPGLEQPACLTNVDLGTISTRNSVDSIPSLHMWSRGSPKVA